MFSELRISNEWLHVSVGETISEGVIDLVCFVRAVDIPNHVISEVLSPQRRKPN